MVGFDTIIAFNTTYPPHQHTNSTATEKRSYGSEILHATSPNNSNNNQIQFNPNIFWGVGSDLIMVKKKND